MRRAKLSSIVVAILVLGFAATPACATVVHSISGNSADGDPVSFKAELTISGDCLTVKLYNTSSGTLHPADLLCSYFFDILNGSSARPPLSYASALGDVYLTDKNASDTLQTANANLKAVNPNDDTWEFKTFDAGLSPFLGFGVGTVGNANLTPNNFNGNVVGDMNYSIYAGDVTTQSLHNRLLVKSSATFTFSGLTGFTEADIAGSSKFGLGTAPESLTMYPPEPPIPEPLTVLGLAAGLASIGLYIRKRRTA